MNITEVARKQIIQFKRQKLKDKEVKKFVKLSMMRWLFNPNEKEIDKAIDMEMKKSTKKDMINAKLSMLNSRMRLISLQAGLQVSDGDRKNPDNWFTINGRKVFIEKGQSKSQAAKSFLGKKGSKSRRVKGKRQPKEKSKEKQKESKEKRDPKLNGQDEWEELFGSIDYRYEKGETDKIKAAFMRIPKSHTDGIVGIEYEANAVWLAGGSYHTFSHLNRKFGGDYDEDDEKLTNGAGSIEITGGEYGDESVFRHEVQHHRFAQHRTKDQLDDWAVAMTELYDEYEKGVTNYVSSFHPYVKNDKETADAIAILNNQVAEDDFSFDGIYGLEVNFLKEEIKKGIDVERNQRQIDMYKEDFESYRNTERRDMAIHRLKELNGDMNDVRHEFYDESHSDVGAFIYEEKVMRERASRSEKKAINEEVMEKAVIKYKEIFGDDQD